MPINIKDGGAWRTVATGGLRIKDGGVWRGASYCKIRQGGAWYDSGYVGYPNPPQSVEHDYWDQYGFTESRWRWTPSAAGAAPTSRYRAVLTDANGNYNAPLQALYTDGSSSRWWVDGSGRYVAQFIGLAEDTRYRFFVRAETAAGLVSNWVEGPRIQMGHTEQGYTQSESYVQGWNSGAVAVNLYNGGASGPHVPDNVQVWGMYVNLSQAGLCGGSTWANLSPGTSSVRNIYYVTADAIRHDLGVIALANPSHGWLYGATGNGANLGWGLVGEGAGYASGPATSNCRVVGDLTVYGDQTLYHDVYHKTRDYLAPSYW